MSEQVPSIGRMVHFMYGDEHYAAIITAVSGRMVEHDPVTGDAKTVIEGQALTVFPPNDQPFTTIAALDPACSSATWHWPEFVPPRPNDVAGVVTKEQWDRAHPEEGRKDWGTSEHPMTRAELDAQPRWEAGETGG